MSSVKYDESRDARSSALGSYDGASVAPSQFSKAPSNLDPALVARYDEKRKAKYQLLRQLQSYDNGKSPL